MCNMYYFCYNYRNIFFIHTMNYFSVVLWIIFLMCIDRELFFSFGEELFFAVSRIYVLAYNALWVLQLKGTGSSVAFPWRAFGKLCERRSAFKENAKAKHCQGKKRKRFPSFLSKSERSQWSVRKWCGFLDWRLDRGDYEATSRLVPYPVSYLESRTIHAGFRNEDAEHESVPYSEHQEEAPDSNPDGRAQQAGQMDSR